MSVTSITKLHGSIWRSFHIRHLVLSILTAAAYLRSIIFSNHVPSFSGTHTVYLRVLPPPHLQRRGRGGPPSTLIFSQALSLLEFKNELYHAHPYLFHSSPTCTAATSLAVYGGVEVPRLNVFFLRQSHFWSSRTSCVPHIHTFSISSLALIRPNSFLRHSLHLILQASVSFNSFPSGVKPVADKSYIRSLT